MLYKYRGYAKNGKRVQGTVEAGSPADAQNKLRSRDIFCDKVTPQEPSILSKLSFKKRERFDTGQLSNLSRDLSIYLGAGISIVNSIRLAKSQYLGQRKLQAFLTSILTMLEEGKSFSLALETQEVYEIPAFYRQSIKVSEDGGLLGEVLAELARFLKEQERLTKQVRNAMFYPIFIIGVSFLMVGFMMSVVVPKITSIFTQMDQELPGVTLFVIDASDFISGNWLLLLLGTLALVALFSLLMRVNKGFRYVIDKMLLKTWLLGKTIHTSELARFSYMTSVLLRSGVPFVQAINLSAKILNNSVLSQVFQDAAKRVVEGGKLSVALSGSDFKVERTFVQAVALGEETSELQAILGNLSDLYFEENKDRIAVFLSLLEPAMMLFVGGVIGFIVTAMLLPIFSMNIG